MANRPSSDEDPKAILNWYVAAGVDMAVEEAAVDQFAASAAPRQSVPETKSRRPLPGTVKTPQINTPPLPVAEMPLEVDPAEAKELAAGAKSLQELEALLRDYNGCTLKLRATQLVFGDGAEDADVMFIGEAPGRDEDLQGKPFVGRSGQLLDKMMAAIGLDRSNVYIANTVPWRPPGNRTPTPIEIAICQPFLHRQIELVDPKFIMTLGAPAGQTMLEVKTPISRMRGQWRTLEIGGKTIKVIPTLHPAFLLRQPAQKRLVWRDMLALMQAIKEGDDA